MIARIWRGTTLEEQAGEYLDYLEATGLRDYRVAAGNRGVFALRRRHGDHAEFLLLTLWESFEAIRRFAGPQPQRARYYPRDENFLLRLEPEVEHYDLVWWSPQAAQAAGSRTAGGQVTTTLPQLPLARVRSL